MQDRIAVPDIRDRADLHRNARGQGRSPRPVIAREDRGSDQHQRPLGLVEDVGIVALAVGEFGQRIRAGTEIVIRIGQIDPLADQRDREMTHAPALADPRVQDRGLLAGI